MTTRQQIQLRWFHIEHVPEMWQRLEQVGLVSLQTGLNNIRGVTGCPAAGLTPNELFDASAVTRHYTEAFLRNPEYTNLPRKFKVTISACLDNCTSPDSQDVGPGFRRSKRAPGLRSTASTSLLAENRARAAIRRPRRLMSSSRPTTRFPCAARLRFSFVTTAKAGSVKSHACFSSSRIGVSKNFGANWNVVLVIPSSPAGQDARSPARTDHVGLFRQRQTGFNYVGLVVPTGRLSATHLRGVATPGGTLRQWRDSSDSESESDYPAYSRTTWSAT